MHPHTIDWLRNVEINADAALAEKRWKTAAEYADDLDAPQVAKLLRLFLFPKPEAALVTGFTEELLKLDTEFPVAKNAEKVRVMAGLVMATTFEKSSHAADAFSLGLRAAQMHGTRGQPAVAGIAEEAEKYLQREASAQRPDDFATEQNGYAGRLAKKYEVMKEAEGAGDADKLQKARQAYHAAVADQAVGKRIRQLAEESQLLWLVVGGFSPMLKRPTERLTAASYAMVAAAEAAVRIGIIPPPPAIDAILTRMLAPCKDGQKKLTLKELLEATDAGWRSQQVAATASGDSRVLLPLATALEKMQELGNAAHTVQALPKLCPGVKADLRLTPADAAQQYFSELSFLAALKHV